MKILELRDGFVKLETNKDLSLSSFLKFDDIEKSYIAQIVQISNAGEYKVIYAKFINLYENEALDYDNSLPAKDSAVSEFLWSDLNQIVNNDSISFGKTYDGKSSICIEKEQLNKKTFFSIDSKNTINNLVSNLSKQFDNYLVIDSLDVIEATKQVAGVDFKLPLNTKSLEFIYEDCLNDATSDSKDLIKEIFRDLAEYSKTVSFLPFTTLKAIVDDMVEKQHIFKLLVLKNKLTKLEALGCFANSKEEADNLLNIITSRNAVIDLSKLDSSFQNRYMNVILSMIESSNSSAKVFVTLANSVNKKNLKSLITGKLSTTIFSTSRFRYLADIKPMFKNYVIEPTLINNQVFKTYSKFLSAMQKDSCLFVGEATKYIPLVISTQEQKFCNIKDEELIILDEIENIDTNENLEEKDSSIITIDENSEELLQQVSEEADSESSLQEFQIFNTEEIVEDEIDDAESEFVEKTPEEIIQEQLQEEIAKESEKTLFVQDLDSNKESLEQDEIILEENEVQDTSQIDLVVNSDEMIEEQSESDTNIETDNEEHILEELENNLDESLVEITEEASGFEEFHTKVDEIQTIEVSEEISLLAEEAESLELEVEVENIEALQDYEQETLSELPEIEEISEDVLLSESEDLASEIIPDADSEIKVLQLEEQDNLGEFSELELSDITDDVILIDIDPEEAEYDVEKEIVEDVNKVYTTMKDESISESDLDFIDELNSDIDEESDVVVTESFENLEEFSDEDTEAAEFTEPLEEYSSPNLDDKGDVLETKTSTTPMVPVYSADIPQEDMVLSDAIEQGDTVVHAKYGNGVVEKMIKYGSKNLYSINFDNVGRRLLDPTLTEIKKC